MPGLFRLALLTVMVQFAVRAETPAENDPVLIERIHKHILESIPKGMSPLRKADVATKSRNGVRGVEFSVELECDEPRYSIQELQAAGKALPASVAKQLQSENLSTRYLVKRHGKGDPQTVQGKFNVRADGTFGAIKSLAPEALGSLQSELGDLPVEGDGKYLAAKAAADERIEALAKAKSERTGATMANIFGSLKSIGNAVGSASGNNNPESQKSIGKATNVMDAASGQSQPVQAAPAPQPPVVAPPVVSPPAEAAGGKGNTKAESEWLTPAEAAAILKISESDVLNAIFKGEIKAKKIGPVWRIPAKELQ